MHPLSQALVTSMNMMWCQSFDINSDGGPPGGAGVLVNIIRVISMGYIKLVQVSGLDILIGCQYFQDPIFLEWSEVQLEELFGSIRGTEVQFEELFD